jgi:hypothetical protein
VGEHIYVSVDFLLESAFHGLDWKRLQSRLRVWLVSFSFLFFGGNWDEIDRQRLGAGRTGVNGLAKYVYIYRFYALLYSSSENEVTDDKVDGSMDADAGTVVIRKSSSEGVNG